MNNFKEYSELYHYGVLGMKWGVRRDRQLLAERKYNKEKNDLKGKYETGELSKEDYKSKRKAAKKEMKESIKSSKKEVKGLSKDELTKKFQKVRKQAINKIPNYRLKAGASIASNTLRRMSMGGTLASYMMYGALGGAAAGGPAGAAVGALMAAGFTAPALVGMNALGKRVDRKILRQFT